MTARKRAASEFTAQEFLELIGWDVLFETGEEVRRRDSSEFLAGTVVGVERTKTELRFSIKSYSNVYIPQDADLEHEYITVL